MTDILKCDLCSADAGDDPYHATVDENGHVHICHECFDPEQHDVGVLWLQRDKLLAELETTESRLHEVATLCATVEQQRDELLNILQRLEEVDFGEHWNSGAEQAAVAARELIRKFEVESVK